MLVRPPTHTGPEAMPEASLMYEASSSLYATARDPPSEAQIDWALAHETVWVVSSRMQTLVLGLGAYPSGQSNCTGNSGHMHPKNADATESWQSIPTRLTWDDAAFCFAQNDVA